MDSRMMKAGVAIALGMTLLIPTFNAINNSYIQVSDVPPWMPPPDKLPENFRPPEDFQPPEDWTPPEGWEPPPDYVPPEGWEDWKPPEDWEGKYEGDPPPGWENGQCPPPVPRYPESANAQVRLSGTSDWSQQFTFDAPEYTVGMRVNVTFLNWTSPEIRGSVTPPEAVAFGDEQSDRNGASGLLGEQAPTPKRRTTWSWEWDPRNRDNELPPAGTYTISLEADAPDWVPQSALRGDVRVETVIVLACGGALS